ncbi:MAG: rhodanese-like domain-containing protein [Epsilonproteobacteria bacterium]|nr:MAG: rhodanese-like domain-containing protein [Campylobacterota bacterium]
MKSLTKYNNILYWLAMLAMFFWFAYTKGWILTNFESINAKQALKLIEEDDNISILDVRTIPEYKEGHLRDSTLIPVQALKQNLGMLKYDKNKRILVYCRSGNRSISASRTLEAEGFTPLNIKGGILSLQKAGITLVK